MRRLGIVMVASLLLVGTMSLAKQDDKKAKVYTLGVQGAL
jgi:hypothetical protein